MPLLNRGPARAASPDPTPGIISQEYSLKKGLSQPLHDRAVQTGMPAKTNAPIVVTVTATGAATTYRFMAAYANSWYHLVITDQTTHAVVVPTSKTNRVIAFPTVAGHVYTVYAVATA